jgi:DNA modification methylase
MPNLTWPSKGISEPIPAGLILDSILYPRGQGYPDASPENRLILGDNLGVMATLMPEFEDQIDLIYADPPFFTNKHFPARIGRGEDSRRPQEWQLAEGYADQWDDLNAYLDFLYPRLALMHRLLSPRGTFYLHLDWHAAPYARILLDELFGAERLLNEIIWTYHGPSPIRRAFKRKHDTILAYTKSTDFTFNADAVRQPYNPNTVKTFASSSRAGFGKAPDLERGKVPEDWWYFPVVARLHNERTGYPTQKPEGLLERILLASSNPGDLVADFFCGSGTFPLVAARQDRRYLACDSTWRAVHTTRARLVSGANSPIAIYNEFGRQIPLCSGTFSFITHPSTLSLDPSTFQPPDLLLDFWEIDPQWDGSTFHSACQACRPTRSGEIPFELKMPVAPAHACVRAITANGEQIQLHV